MVARFDTIELADDGPDRVRISGVRGEPPPPTTKVCLNALGGHRNEVTFVLTGDRIEAKAAFARAQFEAALPVRPAELAWSRVGVEHPDADTEAGASVLLRCAALDPSAEVVGRAFSGAAVEMALAGYPGFHLTAPPGNGVAVRRLHRGVRAAGRRPHVAVLPDGTRVDVPPPDTDPRTSCVESPSDSGARPSAGPHAGRRWVRWRGPAAGTRAGPRTSGVWARTDEAAAWLAAVLTPERIRELLPEAAGLPVTVHPLPNLRAVNVVVEGLLGRGVAASTRFDPQGKAVGEWLRGRTLDIPEALL